MGLSLAIGQILAPLRNYRLIVLALLANFVLMPFAAVGIAKLLRLDEPLGIALLLLGTASGAPFLPLLARICNGNLALSVGLMVLLMVVTVGYMPLMLPLFLEGVFGRSGENRTLAGLPHADPSRDRAPGESAPEWTSRKSTTLARPSVYSEPRFADCTLADYEHAERLEPIWNAGRSGKHLVHCCRLWNRMGLGWASIRHSRRDVTRYRTAQHRGCAGGRRPELQRCESHRHGGCSCDCWIADAYVFGEVSGQVFSTGKSTA
jgi:Sodium Bile acid symporter family